MTDRSDIVLEDGHSDASAAPARYRVTRVASSEEPRGGVSASWESGDARVVFALVLEHELARRAGATPPRITIEWAGRADPGLLDAVRVHAPWVELRPATSGEFVAAARSASMTPAMPPARPPHPRSSADPGAASFTLTQAELSMLFGAAPGGPDPA